MKRYLPVAVAVSLIMFGAGCGKWMETKGDVTEKLYPIKADNPQVQELNDTLGDVFDQTSAVTAVSDFVDYIDSKILKSGSSSEAVLGPDLIQKIAEKEAEARAGGGGQTTGTMLSVGVITDAINEIGSFEGVRVTDDMVVSVKNAVEESLPNLNPDRSEGLTPLEASIVAYALISGDDGSASPETVTIPAEKIAEYVNRITE